MDSRASSVVSRGRSPTRQPRESRGSTSGWAEANRNPQPTQISLESLDAPNVDAGYGVGQRESSPAHQESHGNWYSSRPHERWEAPRAPAPHWGSQQYQPEPSHEEPLFVAVNPFEPGRWRRNVRQTSADAHGPSRQRPSRPTQFAEYPTQQFTSGHFFEHPAQQYHPTQFPAQPSQWFPGPGAQHHSHIPPTMPQFVPAGQYAPRPPQPGYAYAPTPYFPAPESLPVFPPLPTAEDARLRTPAPPPETHAHDGRPGEGTSGVADGQAETGHAGTQPIVIQPSAPQSPSSQRPSRSPSPSRLTASSVSSEASSVRRSRSRARSRSHTPPLSYTVPGQTPPPMPIYIAPPICCERSRSRSRCRSYSRSRSPTSMTIPQPTVVVIPAIIPAPPRSTMPYGFPRLTVAESPVVHTTDTGLPLPVTSTRSSSLSTLQTILSAVMLIFFDFLPGQMYLHFLLRIPSLYFSRVTRIFEDARLSLPDIKRMARAKSDQWDVSESRMWPVMAYPDTMPLPRSLLHFRASWESFIDSLLREWKTFNLISVLLLSAILTLLQIDAASHPITRTSALFSLICALMSLLYGCMFIIRFGTMRKMHKASSFANEAQKQSANIWWNIWVLLAMPAVWLAWSIITFLISIMSFVWLSGSTQDAVDFSVSFRAALGPRIALTVVFALGIIYFVLIVRTFHRYGDPLDREWMRTVNAWTTEAIRGQASFVPSPSSSSYVRLSEKPDQFNASRSVSAQSRGAYATPLAALARAESRPPDNFEKLAPSVPLTSHPSAFFRAPESACALPISSSTVMQLGPSEVEARSAAYADPQWSRAVTPDDWSRFILDVSSAWNGQLTLAQTEDDLPVYTIVPPTRPDNPVPASPGSGGGSFGSDPPRLSARSIPSSDSSYGRVRPSKYNKNGFVALHSPVLEDENAAGNTPLPKSRSRPATPPPPGTEDPKAGPVNPAQNVEQFIGLWNEHYFRPRNLQVSLVQEHGPRTSGPAFAVTLGPLESPTNAVTDETGFGLGSFMTMQDISRILRR